jgi:hypothetical protein
LDSLNGGLAAADDDESFLHAACLVCAPVSMILTHGMASDRAASVS